MFLAFYIDDSQQEKVLSVINDMKESGFGFDYTQKSRLYVTLMFLGELNSSKENEFVRLLTSSLDSKPFKFSFGGIGCFTDDKLGNGSLDKANVAFIPCTSGLDSLNAMFEVTK